MTNSLIEIWKDINGYDLKFEISNKGNIRIKDSLIKIPVMDIRGYKYVYLCGKKMKYIHKLVAEAFIPNPNKYPCVNHINGNKSDNRVENLEWCTYSHNNKEAYRLGLKQPHRGENKNCKSVVMLDDNKNEICIFRKMKYVDKLFKQKNSPNVIRAIKKGTKSCGHYWKYYEKKGVDDISI